MLHLINHASFLLRGGLQDSVWRDVINEVLAKIGCKVCKALIT
jgi:hypothetical protein